MITNSRERIESDWLDKLIQSHSNLSPHEGVWLEDKHMNSTHTGEHTCNGCGEPHSAQVYAANKFLHHSMTRKHTAWQDRSSDITRKHFISLSYNTPKGVCLDIQNVYVHSWLLKHIPKVQVTTLHSSSWQCFGGQSCGLHCHAGHHLPTEVLCSHKPVYRCNWSVYSNHRLWLWLAYSVWPPVLKDKHRDGGILLQFRFTRWL